MTLNGLRLSASQNERIFVPLSRGRNRHDPRNRTMARVWKARAQKCAGEGVDPRRVSQKERKIKEVPQADLKLLFFLRGFAPHIQTACRRTSPRELIYGSFSSGSWSCKRVAAMTRRDNDLRIQPGRIRDGWQDLEANQHALSVR